MDKEKDGYWVEEQSRKKGNRRNRIQRNICIWIDRYEYQRIIFLTEKIIEKSYKKLKELNANRNKNERLMFGKRGKCLESFAFKFCI